MISWMAINASIIFSMVTICGEDLPTTVRIIAMIVYGVLFLASIFCESALKDRIAKLEKELKELKAKKEI